MRVSTAAQHASAYLAISKRYEALLKTQNQVASGQRIQTPADDPSGAVRALDLDRSLAESQQFGRNADIVRNRLSLEEQTLSDATNVLDRIRTLTVQANTSTVDAESRKSITVEMQSRLRELVDIANRKDPNGEYLFAGLSTLVQPFSQSGNSVSYAGDQGVREVQTSPNEFVSDGHSGFDVFLDVTNGNGTFVTSAAAGNVGTGSIGTSSVTDPAAWVRDTYTVHFTSTSAYEVLDGLGNQVTTGTYTSPTTIAFNGVQMEISGEPALDDTFTIAPSSKQDIFTTVANLVGAMNRDTTSDAQQAQFATDMGSALVHLDRALDHISGIRSDVGARLSVLDQTDDTRADTEVSLKSSISDLRDLDYAAAITQLNLQSVGLQAAQSSYARLAQISLFDYL
jgi:flagellar hook-associated protein 3 FlgL